MDGAHSPNVERWRTIAERYFRSSDVDYALMLMWAESGGDPSSFNDRSGTVGLYSMPVSLWARRIKQARTYYAARGVDVPYNIWDPEAQIAVAAWMVDHTSSDPGKDGWASWSSSKRYYPPGSWKPGQTYWNGYEYVNTGGGSGGGVKGFPPRGDGKAAGTPGGVMPVSQQAGSSFYNPLPGAAEPGPGSLFGDDRHNEDGSIRPHAGIDLNGPMGQPIGSAADGVVVFSGLLNRTAGEAVVVRHPNGWTTHYFHLSAELVQVGDQVRAGQPIGLVGATGNAEGPHLHFETRLNGTPVDPLSLKLTTAPEGQAVYTAAQEQELATVATSPTGQYFGSGVYQPKAQMSASEATLTGIIEALSNSVAGGQRQTQEAVLGQPQIGDVVRPGEARQLSEEAQKLMQEPA